MKYLKGINRDVGPTSQPEGTYRYANNAVLKKDYGAIANESGTNEFGTYGYIIGHCSLDNGDFILFETSLSTADGWIVRYDKEGTFVTLVLQRTDFGFSLTFPIKSVSKRVADEYIIYWTDNNNRPAVLNIGRQETANNTTPFTDIYGDPNKTIENLSLLSYSGPVPIITSASVEEGGNLQTGTYYLALAYMGLDRVTTNYITISNAVYVPGAKDTYSWTNIIGSKSGVASNKQVVWNITNLNTTFEFLQPVVLRRAGGGYDAFKLTVQSIEGSGDVVIFSGSENYSTASPAEVIIDYPVYDTAKALEIVDSTLYLGNLTGSSDVGYQPFANAIEVEATTKKIVNFEDIDFNEPVLADNVVQPLNKNSYRHAALSYMQKGYTREEVYAFYIVWVLNDGRETYGYHIPGRTSSNHDNELDIVTDPTTPEEKNMINVFNFHMYSWTDNTNYVNNMGYWENQDEVYPSSDNYQTLDVNASGNAIAHPTKPDLAGENVRHHHFPSNKECETNSNLEPIVNNSYSSSFTTGIDVVDTVEAVNYNFDGDPTNIAVVDHFGQTPPMGNRIEIIEPQGLIRFEVRNITDDPTGATPYYQDSMLLIPGSTIDWYGRVGNQDYIHFQNWQTNNPAPTQDEIDFIAAMNAVGPIYYGGLSGNTNPGPLQNSSFVDGYIEPYGYFDQNIYNTAAGIIANPNPYHWVNPAMGSFAWGGAPGVPPYYYIPDVNDHQTCTWGGGNGLYPYGIPSCSTIGSPPCACGYAHSGTPTWDRQQQQIYFRQWYNGAMPNYLDYDITFEVRWVGSGTATDPTSVNGGYAPSDVNILGFHLNNVKVPAEIADNVQGFRIYRAERDWKNKRVWGQSPAISMRAVGGYDPALTKDRPCVTPWPIDTQLTDFIPGDDGGAMRQPWWGVGTATGGLEYGKTTSLWVRTANPESHSSLYQSDYGDPGYNLLAATYNIEYPNSAFALYDFTLLRQLKNIRPVSYLSLVHYVKNHVFGSRHNAGVICNTVHTAMQFHPHEEARFIRNRAITYQGAADLVGAKGLGFTQMDIIGSGFDNENKGRINNGYTSISCEIAAHDPDWETNPSPSGDESYFTFPSPGACKSWENIPQYNQLSYVIYDQWTTSPPVFNWNMFTRETLYNFGNDSKSYIPLVNLNSLKYNVYSRWNTQKLIQTGYFCPVDNFDPRNPSATFSTKAIYPDGIFGGDTFICRNGYSTGHMDNYAIGVSWTLTSTHVKTGEYVQFSASQKTGNPPPLQYKSLYCTMVESTDNINFRYEEFDNASNLYKCWPHSSAEAVVSQPLTYDVNSQVGHAYDEVYSADNDVRYAIALPFLDDTMTHFPNRIIKSNVDAQTRIDANRIFLANDYKDISSRKGAIMELINFSNLLYIHCERSLFATKGKQTVQLTDTSEAFIGSGDIFQQEPEEVISVTHGYGGRQSIFGGITTRYGYFFFDSEAGKVFQYDGELNEISKLGLEKLFKTLAGNPLMAYFYPDRENIFQDGIGTTMGWDPEYDRMLITVHQLVPTQDFINGWNIPGPFDASSGAGGIRYSITYGTYQIFSNDGGIPSWIPISFENDTYFYQNRVTLSYYPEFKMWGSFHDYKPYLYFNNYLKHFTHPGIEGFFFDQQRHDFPGLFYQGRPTNVLGLFEFEFVVNPNPEVNKLFYNVQYDIQVRNAGTPVDSPEHDAGFTSFYVYNSKQICQETQINPLLNSRVIDTSVVLNSFRDDTDFSSGALPNFAMFTNNLTGVINTSYIDIAKIDSNRSRFVDKYLIIRLKYANSTNNLLNLYSANAGYRQNHR